MRTQEPGFWDDRVKSDEVMKRVKANKKWVSSFDKVHAANEELSLALEYYKEGIVEEADIDNAYAAALRQTEEAELANMLQGEEDQLSAVLKIVAGAGGTESQDWAQMLMRLYQRWAEAHGYKVTVANLQDGDDAGIKTVTFQIEGDTAYGYLKSENGVHRLIRLGLRHPAGRRHHRGVRGPLESVMGPLPLRRRWRPERKQG